MSASRSRRLGLYLSAVSFSMLATFASAQNSYQVLLQTPDKSMTISGELLQATKGQYQIGTIAGVRADSAR